MSEEEKETFPALGSWAWVSASRGLRWLLDRNSGTRSITELCTGNSPNPSSRFLAHLKWSCFPLVLQRLLDFYSGFVWQLLLRMYATWMTILIPVLESNRHNSNVYWSIKDYVRCPLSWLRSNTSHCLWGLNFWVTLGQWFSKFSLHENQPEALLKTRCWVQLPKL